MSKKEEAKVEKKLKIDWTGKKITVKFVNAEKYRITINGTKDTVFFSGKITFDIAIGDQVLIEAVNLKKPFKEIDLTIDDKGDNSNKIVIATSDELF